MTELRDMLISVGYPLAGQVAASEEKLAARWPEYWADLLAWVGHLRVTQGLAATTCQNYLEALTDFGFWLRLHSDGRDLDEVDHDAVDDWLRHLMVDRHLTASTRNNKLFGLKSFFLWREGRGLGRSPVRDIRGAKRPKHVARRYSRDQIQALFRICDQEIAAGPPRDIRGYRDHAMLSLFVGTGPRPVEVVGLRVDQIEGSGRTGRVQFFGKGAKERLVSFDKPVMDSLVRWVETRERISDRLQEPDLLFCSLARRAYGGVLAQQSLQGWIRHLAERAELPAGIAGLKRFRVTFASELYDAGEDLETIRLLMGHEKIETTRRYIATSRKAQRTRMSSDHFKQITGQGRQVPLWLRQQRRQEGLPDAE